MYLSGRIVVYQATSSIYTCIVNRRGAAPFEGRGGGVSKSFAHTTVANLQPCKEDAFTLDRLFQGVLIWCSRDSPHSSGFFQIFHSGFATVFAII